MNDDRLLLELRGWLQEERVAMPDAEEAGRRIAARLPETKQRRRRSWRLPFLARFARRAHSDTTAYRPTSIPATKGHAPIAIGRRTQTMFSPAKAVIAGTLVFAVGGALLIAQPFGQQQASAPGAEGDVQPTWVSGTLLRSPTCSGPKIERIENVQQQRGFRCTRMLWRIDDPRLSGTVTSMWNADVYVLGDGGEVSLIAGTDELVNEGGRWSCHYDDALAHGSGLDWVADNERTVTCHGAEGYEGLSAILTQDLAASPRTIEGLLFEGEVPPLPASTAE